MTRNTVRLSIDRKRLECSLMALTLPSNGAHTVALGNFHIRQCRPIATTSSQCVDVVASCPAALKRQHAPGTVWEGQPFAGWPGQTDLSGRSKPRGVSARATVCVLHHLTAA